MGPKEIKDKDKRLEVQKEAAKSFREYFGDKEVICDNVSELNKKVKDFFEWRNKEWIVPGKGKNPDQIWKEDKGKEAEFKNPDFKEFFSEDMAKFGFIFDENHGIVIVPFYDYLKKLFEGNYKEIPEYYGFLYNIVAETNKFIPSFVLKDLISKNPKRTLELFKNAYVDINNMNDVEELLSYYRTDWDKDFDLSINLFDFGNKED